MKIYDRKTSVMTFTGTNFFELFAYFDTAINANQSLKVVVIKDSPGLTTLPSLPRWIPSLFVENCPDLKWIPEMVHPMRLLSIDNCRRLTHIEGTSLNFWSLRLHACEKFALKEGQSMRYFRSYKNTQLSIKEQ